MTGLTTFFPPEEGRKPSSSAIVSTTNVTETTKPREKVVKNSVRAGLDRPLDKAEAELAAQMLNPKVPPIAYWERVAECETNLDWENGGKWAGGLGIFTRGDFRDADMGTWERFGGEDFAKHPSGATKTEQLVVANRIAVLGYTTVVVRDPERAKIMGVPLTYVWDKRPSGFRGWGCIRNTVGSPEDWVKRNSK